MSREEVRTLNEKKFLDPFAREVRKRCGDGVSVEYLNAVCNRTPADAHCWVIEYVVDTTLHLLPAAEAARGEARTFAVGQLEQRLDTAVFVVEKIEQADRPRTVNTDRIREEIAEARGRVLQIRASMAETGAAAGIVAPDVPGLLRRNTRSLFLWLDARMCSEVDDLLRGVKHYLIVLHDGDAKYNQRYTAALASLRYSLSLALTAVDELIARDKTTDYTQPPQT